MARKPKKSEFLRSLGIFWQIWKSLTDEVLGLGGSDEDLRRIETDGKLRREVAELIVRRKEKKPARPLFPSERLAADLIPDNWEVVEDVEPSEFEVGDLAFPGFLMEGETCIDGEEMRRRAGPSGRDPCRAAREGHRSVRYAFARSRRPPLRRVSRLG